MQDFWLYFELGWQHILDWQGYDHILFVLALCGIYTVKDWRKVLIMVTAFTIGHSITLALSVLNLVRLHTAVIEFLIPITILITALSNILNKRAKPGSTRWKYVFALFFGLIHGMGFSNYLKSLLGKSTNVAAELFAFNIGLEFGQVVIVLAALLLSFVLVRIVKIKLWDWTFFLSSTIFGISFIMAAERLPAIF
jgi:hypothetical protein